MFKNALLLLSIGTLALGCDYTEEKYAEDYVEALCGNLETCKGTIIAAYVDLGMEEVTAEATYETTYNSECGPEAAPQDGDSGESCTFDPAAAKDCVDGLETMSCDFWKKGTGYPAACDLTCI